MLTLSTDSYESLSEGVYIIGIILLKSFTYDMMLPKG